MASGLMFGGFGGGGSSQTLGGSPVSLGGFGQTPKRKKIAYSADGAPVEVDEDALTQVWQPNTGYTENARFGAPPPQQQSAPVSAPASSGGSDSYAGIEAATQPQSIQPTFSPSTPSVQVGNVGNTPGGQITQGGYEGERQLGLQNEAAQLAQRTGIASTEKQQQAQIDADRLSQAAADAAKRGQMELAARLQAEAETRRIAAFSTMTGGGGDVHTQVTRSNLTGVNEQAARDAAFARAKEQAGSTALSSLTAFKDIMAGSGKMGSSLEAGGMSDIVGGGANNLNEFTRDQLMLDLNRAADISDQEYQGNITQRGQDITANGQRLASISALLNMPGLGAY